MSDFFDYVQEDNQLEADRLALAEAILAERYETAKRNPKLLGKLGDDLDLLKRQQLDLIERKNDLGDISLQGSTLNLAGYKCDITDVLSLLNEQRHEEPLDSQQLAALEWLKTSVQFQRNQLAVRYERLKAGNVKLPTSFSGKFLGLFSKAHGQEVDYTCQSDLQSIIAEQDQLLGYEAGISSLMDETGESEFIIDKPLNRVFDAPIPVYKRLIFGAATLATLLASTIGGCDTSKVESMFDGNSVSSDHSGLPLHFQNLGDPLNPQELFNQYLAKLEKTVDVDLSVPDFTSTATASKLELEEDNSAPVVPLSIDPGDKGKVLATYNFDSRQLHWERFHLDTFDGKVWKKTASNSAPHHPINPLKPFIYNFKSDTLSLDDFLDVNDTYGHLKSMDQDPPMDPAFVKSFPIDVPQDMEEKIIESARKSFGNSIYSLDQIPGAVSSDGRYMGFVMSLRRIVNNYFEYESEDADLSRKFAQSDDRLGTFVEEGKGDCEMFNTYLVGLLRQFGVPARLTYGYVTSNGVITEGDAHAWAEVYIPKNGWDNVDATPVSQSEASSEGSPLDMTPIVADEYSRLTDILRSESPARAVSRLREFGELFKKGFGNDYLSKNSDNTWEALGNVFEKAFSQDDSEEGRTAALLLYMKSLDGNRRFYNDDEPTSCKDETHRNIAAKGVIQVYQLAMSQSKDKAKLFDTLALAFGNVKSAFSTRVFTGGLHQHRH